MGRAQVRPLKPQKSPLQVVWGKPSPPAPASATDLMTGNVLPALNGEGERKSEYFSTISLIHILVSKRTVSGQPYQQAPKKSRKTEREAPPLSICRAEKVHQINQGCLCPLTRHEAGLKGHLKNLLPPSVHSLLQKKVRKWP